MSNESMSLSEERNRPLVFLVQHHDGIHGHFRDAIRKKNLLHLLSIYRIECVFEDNEEKRKLLF